MRNAILIALSLFFLSCEKDETVYVNPVLELRSEGIGHLKITNNGSILFDQPTSEKGWTYHFKKLRGEKVRISYYSEKPATITLKNGSEVIQESFTELQEIFTGTDTFRFYESHIRL